MNQSDCTILLTACVNTNGMIFTQINDSSTRLEQYLNAINFYLKNTNCNIVVVENSNFDFTPYFAKEVEEKRIECLCFEGNSYDKSLGKGFGEACIIDYALANSIFIKKTKSIMKITGRVKVDNISKVIKLCKPNTIYTSYSRKYPGVFKSLCVCAPILFWKKFVSQKDQLNDSKNFYFEHLLYKLAIEASKSSIHDVSLFNCPVQYNGYSGTSGRKYETDSFFEWLKKYLYFTLRFKPTYCK